MQNTEKDINKDYAHDLVDIRDFEYWGMAGIDTELPEKKIIDLESDYQNQWLKRATKYWCVMYSAWHGENILADEAIINNEYLTAEAVSLGLLDIDSWTYIYNWPKLLVKKWLIAWYALIKNLYELKQSIANNRPVASGSNTIDWKVTRTGDFIAKYWSSYWHAFLIIGYDDIKKLLICKNSYWKTFWDNGRFYIRYEDFDKLLFISKYSLIDNPKTIQNYLFDKIKKLKVLFEVRAVENQKNRVESLIKQKSYKQAYSYMNYVIYSVSEKESLKELDI